MSVASVESPEISLRIAVKKGVRRARSGWSGGREVNAGRVSSCSSSFSRVALLDAVAAGVCLRGACETKAIGVRFACVAGDCELTDFCDGMMKV